MLHRLQHVVLYGQQLTVLTGDDGAGKTTIVTALVDELDAVSSALVTCPQHADSAEIRRKILVQLLSEPLFDDELPLPETLLDLTDSLPTSSHIVIDDAHYLPLEVWAESIVLSQMLLPGKSISLTLTAPTCFLSELLTQLPESQHQLLLPMVIEPLPDVEREALYYALLHRSEQTPFISRDIVRDQLQRQQGLPSEVVKLLYLALHGEPIKAKVRPWVLPSILGLMAIIIACAAYFLMATDDDLSDFSPEQTVTSVRASQDNFAYGESLLLPYFMQRQQWDESERVIEQLANLHDEKDVGVGPIDPFLDTVNRQVIDEALIEPIAYAEIETAASDKVEVFAVTTTQIPKEITEKQAPSVTDEQKVADKAISSVSGYTLQLASVKKLESLDEIINKLDSVEQIQVARYKQRWVILYGQYDSVQQARSEANRLQRERGIQSPWLRMWADLSQYQLQQGLPTREIR